MSPSRWGTQPATPSSRVQRRRAIWGLARAGTVSAQRRLLPSRQLPAGLFISCPRRLGSRVVSVMCGKEMTIKSLLWFGHSGLPLGSHKGLREAQLRARPEHKSRCWLAGRPGHPSPGYGAACWTLHTSAGAAGLGAPDPGPRRPCSMPGLAVLPSRCPWKGSAAPRAGRSQKPGGQVPCPCELRGFECEACECELCGCESYVSEWFYECDSCVNHSPLTKVQ